MDVVIDIEANALENPTKIWCIVCKDVKTGKIDVFREPTSRPEERLRFIEYSRRVTRWIGHNILGYDGPVLNSLIDFGDCCRPERVVDTLVVSKLLDYSRKGHSVEDYGLEFGLEKITYTDFSKFTEDLVTYCIRDVEITTKIYTKYLRYILVPKDTEAYSGDSITRLSGILGYTKDLGIIPSVYYEQCFQNVVNDLHSKGFAFNKTKAEALLHKVEEELKLLDKDILDAFKPRLKLIREVTPRATKYGTISKSSIPVGLRENIDEFTVDAPFSYCTWSSFNPSSHGQIIAVLNEAGWRPVDRTQTHIETERELNRLKFTNNRNSELDIRLKLLQDKLDGLKRTGWKVNEHNLETLPPAAPAGARLLAKRILLESRRRTLTEWIGLVQSDGRVHGKFYGIGAWTHRMAHQQPNTANIPNELDTAGKKKLYGKELRSLWCAPPKRLLVGVDAEGIQLRIFAHYIDDPEFTEALVNGRKENKTDPHSLNQSILGDVCRSRSAAKRYIYALLLGAGAGKLREILDCDETSAGQAYERLLERYPGFAFLKSTVIPADAKRGWFVGLDGRRVRIPGATEGQRRHLAMSGYLQNGEAVVMKLATLRFLPLIPEDCFLVNFVHDEWQTEVPNDMRVALQVAELQADSLRIVGEQLGLRCPLAGSYYNDDLKDYTIATNWSKTH